MELSLTSHLCFCTSSLSSLPRHLSSSSSSSSSSYSLFSPFRARVHAFLLASNSTGKQKRYGQRPCTVFSQQQQQGDEGAPEKEEEKSRKAQEIEARKQTHEIEEEDHIPDTYKQLAVLMEVEGVVADMHRFGHRHSFNVAFQKLGLDCANWTEPVYSDLRRQAGGSEEKMLSLFFNQIGWPVALPTGQNNAFIQKLLQEKKAALEERVADGSVSLRPGVESFVDEVLDANLPLIILAAYNNSGEDIERSLVQKLGIERARRIAFVGKKEIEGSAYGQVVLGAGSSLGLDEELALEAAKAVAAEKQRLAEEVASILKISIEVDNSFVKISKTAIAALRAGAEIAGVPVQNCILLAGGNTGVEAAQRISMPCVAVKSSLTTRAEFPGARVVLEGFGAGSVTLPRLRRFIF